MSSIADLEARLRCDTAPEMGPARLLIARNEGACSARREPVNA
jgi:hypothetical protein